MSLLSAWVESAAQLAAPESDALRRTLKPLLDQFRLSLRTSSSGRRSRAPTSTPRRAVSGAIDRVADAFLAIDVSGATIVDANPAAGALLGVARDALLGLDLMAFVPDAEEEYWSSQLDAIAESDESLRFEAHLKAVSGEAISIESSVSAFSTRSRTLALIVARLSTGNSSRSGAEVAEVDPSARGRGPKTFPSNESP